MVSGSGSLTAAGGPGSSLQDDLLSCWPARAAKAGLLQAELAVMRLGWMPWVGDGRKNAASYNTCYATAVW